MSWSKLAEWWLTEVETDPAYGQVVTPLLLEVLNPVAAASYVDLGSGDGRVGQKIAARGGEVVGLELSLALAIRSPVPTIVGRIPHLPFRTGQFDSAYAVLVVEHLEGHARFFSEAARLVKAGGSLAVVANHPIWTAPGSTPIQDADGEVLWRPGEYFSVGKTEVQVPGGVVTFFHRSLGALLTAASKAGWALEELIERPHHEIDDQSGIPRLLACRWRR